MTRKQHYKHSLGKKRQQRRTRVGERIWEERNGNRFGEMGEIENYFWNGRKEDAGVLPLYNFYYR